MSGLVSSIEDLRRFLDLSLTAETICENLVPSPAAVPASALREELEHRGYDVAVLEDPESQRVHRYVRVEALSKGTCGDCAEPIPLEGTVAKATSLRDCLGPVVELGRVFVLGRKGVEAIITPADLEKQPVRLLLFGVISTLEMAMLGLIRVRFPEETWSECLSGDRLEKAREILRDRRQRNEGIDLAECLQICDKVAVLLKSTPVWEDWGFGSKSEARKFFNRLQRLRDKLAHGHDLALGSNWSEIVATFCRAEEVLAVTADILKRESTSLRS